MSDSEIWRAEDIGAEAVSERLMRNKQEREWVMDEIEANEREHARLVERWNWLVDEYNRLAPKLRRLMDMPLHDGD